MFLSKLIKITFLLFFLGSFSSVFGVFNFLDHPFTSNSLFIFQGWYSHISRFYHITLRRTIYSIFFLPLVLVGHHTVTTNIKNKKYMVSHKSVISIDFICIILRIWIIFNNWMIDTFKISSY